MLNLGRSPSQTPRLYEQALPEGRGRMACPWTKVSSVLRKAHCKNLAAWRFAPAKPPERLGRHYGLGCEYGTLMMRLWQGGGSGPLYVCDVHAKSLSPQQVQGLHFENKKTA
jgi:hypothetical protein